MSIRSMRCCRTAGCGSQPGRAASRPLPDFPENCATNRQQEAGDDAQNLKDNPKGLAGVQAFARKGRSGWFARISYRLSRRTSLGKKSIMRRGAKKSPAQIVYVSIPSPPVFRDRGWPHYNKRPASIRSAQGHWAGPEHVGFNGAPGAGFSEMRVGKFPVSDPPPAGLFLSCAMGILTAALGARRLREELQWGCKTSLLQARGAHKSSICLDFQARAPGLMEKDVSPSRPGNQQPTPDPSIPPACSRTSDGYKSIKYRNHRVAHYWDAARRPSARPSLWTHPGLRHHPGRRRAPLHGTRMRSTADIGKLTAKEIHRQNTWGGGGFLGEIQPFPNRCRRVPLVARSISSKPECFETPRSGQSRPSKSRPGDVPNAEKTVPTQNPSVGQHRDRLFAKTGRPSKMAAPAAEFGEQNRTVAARSSDLALAGRAVMARLRRGQGWCGVLKKKRLRQFRHSRPTPCGSWGGRTLYRSSRPEQQPQIAKCVS